MTVVVSFDPGLIAYSLGGTTWLESDFSEVAAEGDAVRKDEVDFIKSRGEFPTGAIEGAMGMRGGRGRAEELSCSLGSRERPLRNPRLISHKSRVCT